MRINKFLAACNLGSRRKVEELITSGLVKVNGKVCLDLAKSVNPKTDEVLFKNKTISLPEEHIYIMLNKPPGYLVSSSDAFDRKTVFDLVPNFNTHLFAVGRLDYRSEGLLILTNDGNFANAIIHPKHKLEKVYKVTVDAKIANIQLENLRKMREIEGKPILPAKIFVKSKKETESVLRVTINEGKKRQIRIMMKQVGLGVKQLKRLQIGSLKLGKLSVGMWRPLNNNEVKSLLHLSKKAKEIK